MAKYSGKAVTVNRPAADLYQRISDLSSFQERLNELPEEARQKLGEVKFTSDRMIINAPAVGEIAFVIAERVPNTLLRLAAENSPLPFNIVMNFIEKSPDTTEVQTNLDVDIPPMLRPMVGGKLQQAADKFGEMFSNFFGS